MRVEFVPLFTYLLLTSYFFMHFFIDNKGKYFGQKPLFLPPPAERSPYFFPVFCFLKNSGFENPGGEERYTWGFEGALIGLGA